MRVVTWNIQTGRPNPDGPSDIGRAVDALASLGADVYAVQELDRGRARSARADQPAVLAERLGGELVWAPTVRSGRDEYGIAVVACGEVRAKEQVGLSGTREPRALLVVEAELGGQRWTIGCTHLSRNRSFARQQLVRVFDALADHPLPRVLLGDLNLVPGEVLPWSSAEGYQLAAGPPTHSTRQRRVTRRIDHVLVAGATVTSASVHTFSVSDHRAVAADLEARPGYFRSASPLA